MPFQPRAGDRLSIGGVDYEIAEHPAAPGQPYGQEGRQGIVYKLTRYEDQRALKVFKRTFRGAAAVRLADQLAPFAVLPGLAVAQRTVLRPPPHRDLLQQHTDLLYAVLMPWIEAPTWMEIMLDRRPLSPRESLALARALAETLATLEQHRVAHCDLSASNLMLPALHSSPAGPPAGKVELIDVEQLYGPGLDRPELLPGGSPGYALQAAQGGLWGATADRFAGAVLLAELLCWCDERVRRAAWGESYFDQPELQAHTERYDILRGVLAQRWGTAARLLDQAWQSETVDDCPMFGEWLLSLPEQPRPVPIPGGPGPVWPDRPPQETDALHIPPTDIPAWPGQATRGRPPGGAGRETAAEPIALQRLFADGLAAYRRQDWPTARELLSEVVRREPNFASGGTSAAGLLAQVQRKQARKPLLRAPGAVGLSASPRIIGGIVLMLAAFCGLSTLALTSLVTGPSGTPTADRQVAPSLQATRTARALQALDTPTAAAPVPTNSPLPSRTPEPTLTATPFQPTASPTGGAPSPTPTSIATATAAPSATAVPSNTAEPTDTATAVPTETPLPTVTPTPEPTAIPAYVVQAGERLRDIAERLGRTLGAMMVHNGLTHPLDISPGQTLLIPPEDFKPPELQHQVRSGENLSVIGSYYRVSPATIMDRNNLSSGLVRVGQYLIIPLPD